MNKERGDFCMRRYGNIITENTITLSLCYEAILSAAQHKRHRKDVQNVLSHIKDRGFELQKMILDMTWYPKPYQVKTIIEHGKLQSQIFGRINVCIIL